jgi:acyl-CoA thioester hydrolase
MTEGAADRSAEHASQPGLTHLVRHFPVTLDWPVQWGDQDALGHVNNTVYFRWCESARVAYFERLGLAAWMKPTELGPILAQIECNYKRQLHFPDTVTIGSRVTKLGRSSLTMQHSIVSHQQNAVVAESSSVIVVFNYLTQRPAAIPAAVRQTIEQLEGNNLG